MKIEVVKPTLKESLANIKTRRSKLTENLKDLPADINKEEVAVRPDGDAVALQALEKDREVVNDRLEEHKKFLDDFIYQEEEHRKKAEKQAKKMKVESINVKDRKELSNVLKEAKKANKTFKVTRSPEEGFRYTVELTENLTTFNEIVDLDSDLYDAVRDVVEAWVKRGASFNDFTTSFENCLLHAEDDLECLEDGWDKHDKETEKPVEDEEDEHEVEVPWGGTEKRELPSDYTKEESLEEGKIDVEKELLANNFEKGECKPGINGNDICYYNYKGTGHFPEVVARLQDKAGKLDFVDETNRVVGIRCKEESLEEEKHVCEKCGKEVCECNKQDSRNLEEDLKLIIDISEYEPWSGAVETWDKIVEADKVNELEFLLEDMYPDGLTRTELNDILWFEPEWVFDMLGLSDNSIKDDFEDEDEDEHESTDEALEENKCLKEDENEEELPAVKADIRAETEVADDEEPFVDDDEMELLPDSSKKDTIEVGTELADFDGSEVVPEDEHEVEEESEDLETTFEPAEEVKEVWEKIKEAGKTEKFFETARLLSDDQISSESLNKLLAETDWIKEFLEIE